MFESHGVYAPCGDDGDCVEPDDEEAPEVGLGAVPPMATVQGPPVVSTTTVW